MFERYRNGAHLRCCQWEAAWVSFHVSHRCWADECIFNANKFTLSWRQLLGK
jgi:hypothetical protein